MQPVVSWLFLMVSLFLSCEVRAGGPDSSADRPPAPLDVITTVPLNPGTFRRHFIVNHDGDGIGEEQPSSILYVKKGKDLRTSMTVTDLLLCKRPSEQDICRAFDRMISASRPPLGTDVTLTRIGGSNYRTVFLAGVDSVDYTGVDRFTAFLGGDSQDLPLSDLVVYVYAKKGSSLVQLSASVARCNALVKPGESDVAYYRRNCVSPAILEKASSRAKELTELFRLERQDGR